MKTPTFKPKCPNHGEPLEGCGFPIKSKGEGICPVSGVKFAFAVDVDNAEIKINKWGNPYKDIDWEVTGDD